MRTAMYSFGGCGTLFFQRAIEREDIYHSIFSQGDRHRTNPPEFQPDDKIVYLFGDPRNAVLSFYSRGFGQLHAKNLKVDYSRDLFPRTIEDYICQNRDAWGLELHFDTWQKLKDRPNTLYVRYEGLETEEGLARVEEFLGCGMRKIAFKKRKSNFEKYPELTKIHQSLLDKIKELRTEAG